MSASPSLRTAAKCEARAESFQETAVRLESLEDEWAAVCYFYAAYHLVKAAFIRDPVFDSLKALASIDGRLTMEDRFIERHQGRMSGRTRTLGVNDLVTMLYPKVSVAYRRMHMASINVRYGEGLRTIKLDSVLSDFATVRRAHESGALVSPSPPGTAE